MRGLLQTLILTITALPLATSTTIPPREAEPNAPNSCSAPPPRPNCESKAKSLKWTVQDFDYHASYIFTTPAHQNSYGYVNFNLTSTAVGFTASCSASSSQLTDFFYGTQWYTCILSPDAPAGSVVEFQFNRPTGQLDVRQTVVCPAEKNKPATNFVAAGTTTLQLSCTDTTTINPNWTPGTGQFFSDREVVCAPVDVSFKPAQVM